VTWIYTGILKQIDQFTFYLQNLQYQSKLKKIEDQRPEEVGDLTIIQSLNDDLTDAIISEADCSRTRHMENGDYRSAEHFSWAKLRPKNQRYCIVVDILYDALPVAYPPRSTANPLTRTTASQSVDTGGGIKTNISLIFIKVFF
jgi:hypothetical protein